jgi:septal ring factor EnvC (AmiA/AmiB activator)
MHPIGTMMLGAAGLATASLAALARRKLRGEIEALRRRVEELDTRTAVLPALQAQADQNTLAIQDIQAAVSRMEQGFAVLGDRLTTQIEILEALQSSYTEKEEKLQLTLRAVLEAVNDIRRAPPLVPSP